MRPDTSTNRRILIHSQYLYGIGHYVRSVELARGLSEQFEVFMLNGGEVVPNFGFPQDVTCIQLPAIYKEETANYLSPVDPSLSISECFELRKNKIDRSVEQIKPDILITEHFPFGRLLETEVMELIAKVKEVKPTAKIVSSVRDVVESSEGGKHDAHTCELLNKWYDMVLVHGDEHIVPFSSSFPMEKQISIPIHQTGYIVSPIAPSHSKSSPPALVVSVGGGRIGGELLSAVLKAHPSVLAKWNHQLVLFAGAFQQHLADLYTHIEEEGYTQVTVNDFDRDHYQQTLSTASAIICLGGYNSLIEAVSARIPTLVYKRKFHGTNKEQDLRATLFQRSRLIRVFSPEELTPAKLADRILQTVRDFQTPGYRINVEGVTSSLNLLLKL